MTKTPLSLPNDPSHKQGAKLWIPTDNKQQWMLLTVNEKLECTNTHTIFFVLTFTVLHFINSLITSTAAVVPASAAACKIFDLFEMMFTLIPFLISLHVNSQMEITRNNELLTFKDTTVVNEWLLTYLKEICMFNQRVHFLWEKRIQFVFYLGLCLTAYYYCDGFWRLLSKICWFPAWY